MRCPNCNKFVSLENGDPEVEQLDVSADGDSVRVEASIRGTRNCADCSDTMKELSMEASEDIPLEKFEVSRKDGQSVGDSFSCKDASEVEWAVEDDGGEVNEGGGGRYQKNMIETVVNYTVTGTLTQKGTEFLLKHSGSLSSENAAGEFEECC